MLKKLITTLLILTLTVSHCQKKKCSISDSSYNYRIYEVTFTDGKLKESIDVILEVVISDYAIHFRGISGYDNEIIANLMGEYKTKSYTSWHHDSGINTDNGAFLNTMFKKRFNNGDLVGDYNVKYFCDIDAIEIIDQRKKTSFFFYIE